MNEIHTIVVGMLNTPPFDKRFQLAKRVYAVKGIAPACNTCAGGGLQPKIFVEYDLASHYYSLSHRGSEGISQDTRRQRRLPLSG